MATRSTNRTVKFEQALRAGMCVLLLAGAMTMSGCLAGGSSNVTTTGTFVSGETLDSIRAGESTRDDVISALGSPSSKSKLESGGEVWRYTYTRVKQSSGYILFVFGGRDTDVKTSTASVRFRPDGIVEKVWRDSER